MRAARETVLRALDRANVTVHSIDPTGLETPIAGVGAVERRLDALRANTLRRQDNLAVLPSYTGGRTVRDTNEPGKIIPRIFAETSSYYLLGFERREAAPGRGQRAVKVRVNRPGVTVVARKAYYPPSPVQRSHPTDPLSDAVTGLLPISEIPLALSLTSVFTRSAEVKTRVLMGVKEMSAQISAGSDLLLSVFDDRGKEVLSERRRFEPRARPCDERWCESILEVPLRPGRYEVRLGVFDAESSKRGSVFGYIEVPTLRPETFLLSDLQIGATATSSESVAPSVRRTFHLQDLLFLSAQVHRPRDSTAPVIVRATITHNQTKAIVQSQSELAGPSFSDAGVSELTIRQPLSVLRPGAHTVAIEASHLDRVVRRTVSFEIQ